MKITQSLILWGTKLHKGEALLQPVLEEEGAEERSLVHSSILKHLCKAWGSLILCQLGGTFWAWQKELPLEPMPEEAEATAGLNRKDLGAWGEGGQLLCHHGRETGTWMPQKLWLPLFILQSSSPKRNNASLQLPRRKLLLISAQTL